MINPNRSGLIHRWVPAEHRWLGLDKRTILPAAIVLATAAVMHWGVPWLDEQVPYSEQTTAGDTITMTGDVVFTPPPGWSIESGVVTGEGAPTPQVIVSSGPTSVQLRTASWDGNVQALFEQVERTETITKQQVGLKFMGDPQAFVTATGDQGLFSPFTSTQSTGAIGAVLVDVAGNNETGVEVTVVSPTSTTPLDGDVGRLVASITDGSDS